MKKSAAVATGVGASPNILGSENHFAKMRGLTSDIAVLPATVIQKVLLLWPMHKANPDGFAALLEAGANANQTDHRGSLIATFAAKNPDISYLEALLRAGTNPNARNTDREPLTFVAAMEETGRICNC